MSNFRFQDHAADTRPGTVRKPVTQKTRPDEVENSDGGFVFKLNLFKQLERFLVMGTEGGTYYISERKLTSDNIETLKQCLAENAVGTIDTIVDFSVNARVIKNETCVFALAYASASPDKETRRYALSKLSKVCRIGTDLFAFCEYAKFFRGRGRLLSNALKNWYLSKSPDSLQYQLAKYQSRNGWAHRDVLRLCKPKTDDPVRNAAFAWSVDKFSPEHVEVLGSTEKPSFILGFEDAKKATSDSEVIALIEKYGLTREMIPTQFLNGNVWKTLIVHSPYIATLRNLGVVTANGALEPLSSLTKQICARLKDPELIKKSKVHPMQILAALFTYKSGRGLRGSLSWTPIQQITTSLETAFYESFKNVEPSGKNMMLCLDVSSSMTWHDLGGIPGFTPAVASAVMAMITVRSEENYMVMAFSNNLVPVPLTKYMSFEQTMQIIRSISMGGTNLGLPIEHAIKQKLDVDAFVVYTDNEVNHGYKVPDLIAEYRRKCNKPDAKMVVVGMEVNQFTVADPKDFNMMDFAGFDPNTPSAISSFVAM